MKIAVTGADGFLARHLRVRLRALAPDETVTNIGRKVLNDDRALDEALTGADAVVHLAGVNRGKDAEVEGGNVRAAELLVAGLDRVGGTPRLVYGNSRQAGDPPPTAKARPAQRSSWPTGQSGPAHTSSTWCCQTCSAKEDGPTTTPSSPHSVIAWRRETVSRRSTSTGRWTYSTLRTQRRC